MTTHSPSQVDKICLLSQFIEIQVRIMIVRQDLLDLLHDFTDPQDLLRGKVVYCSLVDAVIMS